MSRKGRSIKRGIRQRLESTLTHHWYQSSDDIGLMKSLFVGAGRPIERQLSTLLRNRMRRRKKSLVSEKPAVIVVGNLTVGGSGKTPVTIMLAEFLLAQGLKVGLISRGYGAKKPHRHPHWVTPADRAEDVGDETRLLTQRLDIPMVVGVRRLEALNYLCQRAPDLDVVLSDDGLQHYALPRTIECVVVDGEKGFGNAQCLPFGPLREPLSRLNQVDCILITGQQTKRTQEQLLPFQNIPQFTSQLELDGFFSVRTNKPIAPSESQPKTAITGIAHPDKFFSALSSLNIPVEHCRTYPDHYRYQASDFTAHEFKQSLVMTEKDAVKCREFASEQWCYLKVSMQTQHLFWRYLTEQLGYQYKYS